MIPQIIKKYLNINTTNILQNFIDDPNSYFITPNKFHINYIRIGSFNSSKMLDVKINDFIGTKFNFNKNVKTVEEESGRYYYKEVFTTIQSISTDLKINVSAISIDFYFWANLWYSTLDTIKVYLEDLQEDLKNQNIENFKIHPKLKFSTIHKRKSLLNKINVELNDIKIKEKEDEIGNNKEMKENKINQHNYVESNFPLVNNGNKDTDSNEEKENPCNNNLNNDIYNAEYDNLLKVIEKLNHNSDLNFIIDKINKCNNRKQKPLNKNNLNIILHKSDLDKFDNSDKNDR